MDIIAARYFIIIHFLKENIHADLWTVQEKIHRTVRYNEELCQQYESAHTLATIKVSVLRWVGHVERMDETELARKDCRM